MKTKSSKVLWHTDHPCTGLSHLSIAVNLRYWVVGVLFDRVGYLPHSKWMYHFDVMILLFHLELTWISKQVGYPLSINVARCNPTRLPDGSGFFVGEVAAQQQGYNPIHWNPGNKVVQDYRDGRIIQPDTDIERGKRGLPIPWLPSMAERETLMGDVK